MKSYKTSIIAVAVIAAFSAGCASTPTATAPLQVAPSKVSNAIPGWFIDPPASTSEEIYAVGTALSRDLSMSVIKATLDADTQMAHKIAGEVNNLTKDYKQEVGDDFSQSTQSVSNKTATNVKVIGAIPVKKVILPEGGGFRTYVLIRFPLGSNNQMLQNHNSKQSFKGSQEQAEQELERKTTERQEPVSQARAPRLADNSGIVVRSTRATSDSGPLGVSDSGEEN